MSRYYIVRKDRLVELITAEFALDALRDYSGSELLSSEDFDDLRESANYELLTYPLLDENSPLKDKLSKAV